MEEFKIFFDDLLGPKYFSIENDDESISFIPMSQKSPVYQAYYIPDNICNVYENILGDDLILEHNYIYLDDRWQKNLKD